LLLPETFSGTELEVSNARHTDTTDDLIPPGRAPSKQRLSARALRLGGRLKLAGLDTEGLNQSEILAKSPLLMRLHGGGFAGLFPYGTVVFIGVSRADEDAFLKSLDDRIEGRLESPIVTSSEIAIGPSAKISGDLITVRELSPSSLAVVADALAKNVALAFEEAEVGKVLQALEPFAGDLADSGRLPRNRGQMLRTVGKALRIHHRLIDRVEVEDRPNLLPDDDEADRLHEALADASHLKKRAKSLARKLDVIEVMTTALTELIDAQREIRVEFLIVLLIAVEIAIWIFELFLERGQ
jgi:uncharacterized Rmd1/YagE family protein